MKAIKVGETLFYMYIINVNFYRGYDEYPCYLAPSLAL